MILKVEGNLDINESCASFHSCHPKLTMQRRFNLRRKTLNFKQSGFFFLAQIKPELLSSRNHKRSCRNLIHITFLVHVLWEKNRIPKIFKFRQNE